MNTNTVRRLFAVFSLVAILCAAITLPMQAAADGTTLVLPEKFYGNWNGFGTQVNPDSQYPIQVNFTGGTPFTVVGTMNYPSVPCDGTLIMWNALDENRMQLGEAILNNPSGSCDNGGYVVVTYSDAGTPDADDDTLTYEWWHPVYTTNQGMYFSATLNRVP